MSKIILGWSLVFLSASSFAQISANSLSLDGTNYVSVPDDPIFNLGPNSSHTFEGWFNLCTSGQIFNNHFCGLMSPQPGQPAQAQAGYYFAIIAGTTRFYGQMGPVCGVGANINLSGGLFGLDDNQWHHYIVRVNTSATQTRVMIFIDGVLDADSGWQNGIINNSAAPYRMGVYVDALGNHVSLPQGRFDEFRVYDWNVPMASLGLATPPASPPGFADVIFDFEPGPPSPVCVNSGTTGGVTGINGTHNTCTTGTAATMSSNAVYMNSSINLNPLNLGPDLFLCLGEDATLNTGETSGLIYTWELSVDGGMFNEIPGAFTNMYYFNPTSTGVYQIVVSTSMFSCIETDTITISVGGTPTPYFTEYHYCQSDINETIPFFDHPDDGVSHHPYTVTCDVSGAISTETIGFNTYYSFSPSILGLGVHTITICKTENGVTCCEDVVVTVSPTPSFVLPTAFCETDEPYKFHLFAMPSGATDLVFTGSTDAIEILPTGFWFNPSLVAPGAYTFSACYTNDFGQPCCKEYAVTVTAAPTPIFSELTMCIDDAPIPFFDHGVLSIPGPSYTITADSPLGQDAISPNFTSTIWSFDPGVAGAGIHEITICEINGTNTCCTTLEITVCNPPDFDLNWDGCDLISADVHAPTGDCGGPYTYDWTGPGISSVGIDYINVNAIGLYTCTVTNAAGCSTTLDVGVKCDPPKIKISNITKCELPATLVASIDSSCPLVSTEWTGPSGFVIGYEPTLEAMAEGTYTFTATDVLGCSATVTYILQLPEVEIVFDAIAPISLCEEPGLIPITYSTTGVDCEWVSYPTAFDPITGLFDPVEAGHGDYLFVLECSEGACAGRDSITVVVLDDLFWHQTTNSAFIRDSYNDVITDAAGNVYVTGSFRGYTSLRAQGLSSINFDLASIAPAEKTAFIAKYNKCGELLWIAQEFGENDSKSEGTALVLDETNNYVYLVGNFNQQMRLMDGVGPAPSCGSFPGITALMGGSSVGFVARLSMVSGCVDILAPIQPATRTGITSITLDRDTESSANTEIYIAGTAKGGGPSLNGTNSFVKKYSVPNVSAPAFPIEDWQITIQGPATGSYRIINEIDFDETLEKLWIIGNFRRHLELSDGGPSYITSPSPQAFVASYDVSVAGPTHYWSAPASHLPEDSRSSGTGIAVDDLTGQVFITGSFRNSLSNPFGLGTSWSNTNNYNSYHLGMQTGLLSPTLLWSNEAEAGFGGNHVIGADVSFANNEAHFVGRSNSGITLESAGVIPFIGPGGWNTFTVSYNQFTGTGSSLNATDNSIAGSRHFPNAIHANGNGKSFVVGTYRGTINYQVGVPASGPLTSSTIPTNYNAFVMRVDRTDGGSYRSQEVANEEPEEEKEELKTIQIAERNLEVSVYPNPTNGELKVNVVGFDSDAEYKIELRSIAGQLIWSENLMHAQSDFDLSELDSGMYLLSISNKGEHVTKRIVKE